MSNYTQVLTVDGFVTPSMVLRDDGVFVLTDPQSNDADAQAYQTWLKDGNAPGAPARTVPQSVTPRQARLALLAANLLTQVENVVTTAGGATKISWDYATEIRRDSPLIATLAASIPLTSAQIDNLFIQAATL